MMLFSKQLVTYGNKTYDVLKGTLELHNPFSPQFPVPLPSCYPSPSLSYPIVTQYPSLGSEVIQQYPARKSAGRAL